MKLLFINACIRGERESRTFGLCQVYIKNFKEMHPDCIIEEVKLDKKQFQPLNNAELEYRNQLISEKKFDDAMFRPARQFVEADYILVGTPLWDLSFPAVLKAYFETIMIRGITFVYDETGMVGLSKASQMVYVSTSGGYVSKDYGYGYVKSLLEAVGIPKSVCYMAMGLDIRENNVEQIVSEMEAEIQDSFKK